MHPKIHNTSFVISFVFSAGTPSSVFKWTGLNTFLSPRQACMAHIDRIDEGDHYLFGEFVVKKKWVVHSHHSLCKDVTMETRHPRPLWRSWLIFWLYWYFPRNMFGFQSVQSRHFWKKSRKTECVDLLWVHRIYKHRVWGVGSRERTCVCSKPEAL